MTSYSIENDRWLTFGLAFVGGYGDAAGFILGKTFTGHVTGNLVLVAISLVARDVRSVFRQLVAIALFLLGVVVSSLAARTRSARSAPRVLPYIMLVEVVLMGTGAFVLSSQLNFRVGIFLACTALALGLQNGAFRHAGGTSVHTTYLTGMTTNLIASVAGRDNGVSHRLEFPDTSAVEPDSGGDMDCVCGRSRSRGRNDFSLRRTWHAGRGYDPACAGMAGFDGRPEVVIMRAAETALYSLRRVRLVTCRLLSPALQT